MYRTGYPRLVYAEVGERECSRLPSLNTNALTTALGIRLRLAVPMLSMDVALGSITDSVREAVLIGMFALRTSDSLRNRCEAPESERLIMGVGVAVNEEGLRDD